jgi:hypothetical protein
MTEDDNLRVRHGDVEELERTEVRRFFILLKTFEQRLEQRQKKLQELNNKNGKG